MKKELTKSLIGVQMALNVPKSKYNEFGNFNFRSAEDILEEVKPLLAGLGLVLTINDEMVVIGDRYYIKATATITDGEDSVSVSAYAREDESRPGMSESQCTGCSSSYARKYVLNGLFCIDDGTDSDSFNNKKTKAHKVENTNAELPKEFCTEMPGKSKEAAPKTNSERLTEFCSNEKKNPATNRDVLLKFFNFYNEKINGFDRTPNIEKLWNNWLSKERS